MLKYTCEINQSHEWMYVRKIIPPREEWDRLRIKSNWDRLRRRLTFDSVEYPAVKGLSAGIAGG